MNFIPLVLYICWYHAAPACTWEPLEYETPVEIVEHIDNVGTMTLFYGRIKGLEGEFLMGYYDPLAHRTGTGCDQIKQDCEPQPF